MKKSMLVLICVLLCMFAFCSGLVAADVTELPQIIETNESLSTGVSPLNASSTEVTEIASGTCGAETNEGGAESVTWVLTSNGKLTIRGTGAMADYKSGSLAPWVDAGYGEKVKSVVIEKGVTSIGNYTFYQGTSGNHPNMTDITIPGSVTQIGTSAFQGLTGLTEVVFPEGVTKIGNNAFRNCSNLAKVTFPNTLENIGQQAFDSCNKLESVQLPSSVATMGKQAFQNCTGLASVEINSTVLGESAFSGCSSLNSITFGNSLSNIGSGAFIGCASLKEVTIPAGVNTMGQRAFRNCTALESAVINSSSLGSNTFQDCTALKKVTIGANLESISSNAFSGCTALVEIIVDEQNGEMSAADGMVYSADGKTLMFCLSAKTGAVTIPNTVTEIAAGAFSGCANLTSITIPESVKTINNSVFSGCSGLKEVDLSHCTSIGDFLFTGCTGLEKVSLPASINKIGTNFFSGCSGLEEFTIPASVTTISEGAFSGCTGLTSIVIPENVTTLGAGAFSGCSGLTEVTLNGTVASSGTFENCTSLKKITLGKKLADFNASAFKGCASISEIIVDENNTNFVAMDKALCSKDGDKQELVFWFGSKEGVVTIPAGITALGDNIFDACGKITKVNLPDGLTSIGKYCFRGCSSLASVNLPDGLISIDNQAFRNCALLTSVTIPASVTTMGSEVFENCAALIEADLPSGLTAMGSEIFYGCTGLKENVIPNAITEVPASTFKDCTALERVTLPAALTLVGNGAFQNCTALKVVYFEGTKTYWESSVTFYGGNDVLKSAGKIYKDTSDDDLIYVQEDLAAIELADPVLGDLTLPVAGELGSTIVWESSNPNVIDPDSGKVTRGVTDTKVTLTATAAKGKVSEKRVFELTVKADSDANTDAVNSVLDALALPIEVSSDISMPEAIDETVTLTWESSHPEYLATDGDVTQPSEEVGDVSVTLTATISKGDVTKTKEFAITVYSETSDKGVLSYRAARNHWLNTKLINGYWNVFAAYAALGDYIQDPANGYTFVLAEPESDWFGTQYGATVMAIVMMGENPYNYNGKNWVKILEDNFGGAFAGPVYSQLGMEAAGADKSTYEATTCAELITPQSMTEGIDIAGWALVSVAKHKGESGIDEAVKTYLDYIEAQGMSDSGNIGYNNYISTGCALMGFAALMGAGYEGSDPAEAPWVSEKTGKSVLDAVYDNNFGKSESIVGYANQAEVSVSDYYNVKYKNGESSWVACAVDREKLNIQIAKANEILANRDDYTEASVEAVTTALNLVNIISESRLNDDVADYGKEYYALYDAVRYAVLKDAPVVDQTALNEAKAVAVAELEAAFAEYDSDDYTATNWDDLVTAKEVGIAAINAAKTEQTVLSAKENALDAMAAVPVSGGDKKIEVTFRLIGATRSTQPVDFSINPGEYYGSEYQNWIKTTTYRFDEGATVYDVLIKALNENGMTQTGGNNNYVASITAPAVLGGEKLSEFDNGINSGWMYTINGLHPGLGVKQYVLEDGDALVVHYVNDFKYEDESTYPDSPYLNKWLEVPDLAPGETPVDPEEPVELPFTDVADDFWGMDAIEFVYAKGIMNGTSDTTFEPNKTLSRAMYITMIYRLEGAPAVVGSHEYSDVLADKWYTNAVIWGTANGIITGYENGTFRPDGDVSREEMATMMYRYAAYKGIDVSATAGFEQFNDGATVSDWSKTYMGWAVAEGLMKGDTDGNLKPTGQATRAEAATVIMRFADIVK